MSIELKQGVEQSLDLSTPTLREMLTRHAAVIDSRATLEDMPEALAFQIDMARALLREFTAIQQAEAQQPVTATACGIPGMAKTTCPYCEQGFTFEHEQPATPEPVAIGYINEMDELVKYPAPCIWMGQDCPRAKADRATHECYQRIYTHPAPSVPGDDFDLICNAIDKADTITMEGDYMLDSDDCIAVVRVMQVLLSVRAAMLAAAPAAPSSTECAGGVCASAN